MRSLDIPVLIVGAGPAGLTATALLATAGIRSLTVTRYSGTANSPQAHITNQRTVEVLRDPGIEDRLQRIATPAALMSNNVWATSFAGTEIARLQTWGTSPERRADYELASPSTMCNAPQHLLEPVLLTALGRSFRAVSDDREIAELMGLDANRVYALATAVAFLLVTVAGVLQAMRTTVAPSDGPLLLLFAFEAEIIGGMGSSWGTFAGALVLGLMQQVGSQFDPGWGVWFGHLVFLAVLAVRPQDLCPKTRG